MTKNLKNLFFLIFQIFEILKHFSLEQFKSFNVDWDKFLKSTTWILENLERINSNPPCFLLATVYINICSEVCKVDKMYLKSHVSMLHILVPHLVEYEKLKQGPAREDYKISVMKFIHSVTRETFLIQQCVLIKVYLYSLRIPETQIIAWSTIMGVINEVTHNDISVFLLNYGVGVMRNSIQDIHKYNPELQDAMFNFLYNSLMYLNQFELSSCIKTIDICKFVLNEIRLNNNKSIYCERDSYLRLLGKSYVTLASFNDVSMF